MKRVLPLVSAVVSLVVGFGVRADTVKPRFVILVDTSGSMAQTAANVNVHGDGSENHPGCDLDGNGRFDDSKLFQAKAALNDTLVAFGSVEFALARYDQIELGQSCNSAAQCAQTNTGANVCVAGRCGWQVPRGSPDYDECRMGAGCERCKDPDNDPTHVFYNGTTCCGAGGPTSQGFGLAGDVVVPFPGVGSNLGDLTTWIDGKEDFPEGNNRELRAAGTTPIGGALNAVRDWLVNDNSAAGGGGGVVNRDDRIGCRSYNVILITDGLEVNGCVNNCRINATRAAELLANACTNNGVWDPADRRCEINGSPAGTTRVNVKTYVVGFAVNDPQLNAIAVAGGTGSALLANNQAELTARLGDILAGSIPTERCDCQDNTCDGAVDETFKDKGGVCAVGLGRCKRQGTLGCKADGSGLVCSASPAGMCPASELMAGAAVPEQCGAAPGCEAPTGEDCADDDCDGLIDENMTCACAAKPEVCNGLDDDCNGKVDDVPPTKCGLEIGECRPGITVCEDDGQGGKRAACMGATLPKPEVCDNKDNDCDGLVDSFGLACYPGEADGCLRTAPDASCASAPVEGWKCVGVCRTGVVTCSGGQCGACLGAVLPTTELACDGVDNDCDGEIDEGFGIGGPCGPGMGKPAPCAAGVLQCVEGALRCMGGRGPIDEVCNAQDDDCDGTADNLPGPCGNTRGECKPGKWRCEGDIALCDQPNGPKLEICNGKDDDCNGAVDDNVSDEDLRNQTTCGSSVGICRPGFLKCVGGGKFCEGAVEAEGETCNGKDDDCDNMTDEGINPPGPCPAPGLPPGSPIRGECRPGQNVCGPSDMGAAWSCMGGIGPVAESCDGKDNDCDGDIDDAASCASGQGCADGECVPRCGPGLPECAPDRLCREGLCRFAECALKPCPAGFRCDTRRGCIDRCEGVQCPADTRCVNGECTSCFLRGCPAGQVCRRTPSAAGEMDACVPNPCAGVRCSGGQYCRDGKCVKTCVGVTCGDGEVCRDGACVKNACAGKSCALGEFCDPKDGRCKTNGCATVTCLGGQACVPQSATCVPDPCAVTTCPAGLGCRVRADGVAECSASREVGIEGGGCAACAVGGPDRGAGWALLFVLAGAALRLRRRRW